MALAPGFPTTPYAYFMYTTTSGSSVVNRIVRLTADGDRSVANSAVTLWESEPLEDAVFHFGGGMWFGTDGKLYFATGDRLISANPQSLNTMWGKILRLNPDGTIPTDNPFYTQTTGANRAIYARGLRNPWQSTQQQSTGRVFLSTVGRTLGRAQRGRARRELRVADVRGDRERRRVHRPALAIPPLDGQPDRLRHHRR